MIREGWAGMLALIDAKTKVLALVALVADAGLFCSVPFLPPEHRVYGLLVCAAVLFCTLIATIILAWVESPAKQPAIQAGPAIEPLLAKVKQLQRVLAEKNYTPDLVIGIARSGLAVAGLLAKTLRDGDPIPTISLCRVAGGFDNAFNNLSLNRQAFGSNARVVRKILIVDEFCSSGRTLAAAKKYVEQSIISEERKWFKIETAAIYFYDIYSAVTYPSYFVDRPRVPLTDSGGDEEEP